MLQLRFTFSCRGGRIIGRSVVDIRVCASTGRDRDNDEQKLSVTSSDTAPVEGSDASKRPKKRPALTQNFECAIPTKVFRSSLSQKQSFTIEVSININNETVTIATKSAYQSMAEY